jgi:ribosomal protein L21E
MSKTVIKCSKHNDTDNHEYILVDDYGNMLAVIQVFVGGYVNIDVRAKDAKARVFPLHRGDKGRLVAHHARALDVGVQGEAERNIISIDCNHPGDRPVDNGLNL